MADETAEWPPFKSIPERQRQNVEFTCTYGSKRSKISVSVGVYEAAHWVERLSTGSEDKDIVYAKHYEKYLALHELEKRLRDPEIRKQDYDTLKQEGEDAWPFELWDTDGTKARIPSRLVLTNKPYDDKVDEAQLRIWKYVASNLGDGPSERSNRVYARFSLRPSDTLEKKPCLLYCTPAESPRIGFGVTTDKLKAIIAANSGRFGGWPDPVVVDFETARDTPGLKLVGQNFLQFYFVWMKVEDYRELWRQFRVDELLHPLPAEGKKQVYQDVNMLTGGGGQSVEVGLTVSSMTLRATGKRKDTKQIMGATAREVADRVWPPNFIRSGMGGDVQVEWLHRVAFSLGGQDVSKNLIFGTWECNTDMIRAENMIKQLTKMDKIRSDYQGRLATIKKASRTLSRFTLAKENTDAVRPSWAKDYCESNALLYRYEMDEAKCPLNKNFVQEICFDPWSLYVPLSIEPRLDMMILDDLRNSTADVVTRGRRSAVSNDPQSPVTMHRLRGKLQSVGSLHSSFPISSSKSPPFPIFHFLTMGGFVVEGQVELFGTTVDGNLEKWFGPPPDHVVVGTDPPFVERVVIPGDFHLSTLIPLLRGTPFDKIVFRNVAIYHQNYAFDKTKTIGWHFNADWVIDSSCGTLYDILTKALQVSNPILSVHTSFGTGLHWGTPLELHSFILDGVFPRLTLSPVPRLTLTSIGVRLLGIRGFSFTPKPHSTLSFGFGLFGTMKLTVPGSVMPLNLDYEMGFAGSTVSLRAEIAGSIWEDALGVKGLLLEDVVFGTTFSPASRWRSFAFEVSATFSYRTSQAYLQGTYAADGHFSLAAALDNFGTEEIDALFYAIFSDSLTLPEFDVQIGSAVISIKSGLGLSISLLNVQVEGYTAASVELTLSSSGVSLSGALSSSTLTFGDVKLRDARIEFPLWAVGKNKKVDLMLAGRLDVDFLHITVAAVVHLYPGERGPEWAIVGELNAPGRPFAISDVVPAVKNTFVDFSLNNAVFIAASTDAPLIGQSFSGYNVRQGVHVFGVIHSIPALNEMLRGDVEGLVLNAGWSRASGFNLLISLPSTASIDFGNGIKTTPITLSVQTSTKELAVAAGVKVPVKDSIPLDFSFILAANSSDARASVRMEEWVKPFGVDNLKIGPVTLSIGITYRPPPCRFTFGVLGKLAIGSTTASLALSVSQDPRGQLLSGDVRNLDISDLVKFAGTLVQQEIPQIPDDMLTFKFEELTVYICPIGVVLESIAYPQGFSFKADMLVFGKRADIECTIDKAQKSVHIAGGIDPFEFGPLTVSGMKGPRAALEFTVGASEQRLFVDGAVSIFDAQAQTYIDVQFLPQPKFKFYSLLQFAEIFMFKLDALMVDSYYDSYHPHRLSDAIFILNAQLQNDILEFIAAQITEQFGAAKVVATNGLKAAQEEVQQAKAQWKVAIADAEKNLTEKKQKWELYEQDIRSSSQLIVDRYDSEVSRLQGEVDNARQIYNDALDDARRKLDQANEERGAALASAQRNVEKARRAMNNAIRGAQRELDDAEAEMSMVFGNAKRDIDNAQREVWSLQNQINDLKRTIDEYDEAPGHQFWKKAAIPGLWIAVGTLEASKEVASRFLGVARDILTGSEYVATNGGIGTARTALEGARLTGQGSLSIAEGMLHAAEITSKAAVDAADIFLKGVQIGTQFISFQVAIEALEVFKKTMRAAYDAAMAAIKGLMESAAFIAFNAAKAGLEVARASTKILDVANEALALTAEMAQGVLSILETVVRYGARAVNITSIMVYGALRGNSGSNAPSLSASVQGYIAGRGFDIRAEFDPSKPVEVITALFKQLWAKISGGLLNSPANEPLSRAKRVSGETTDVDDRTILAASSTFLKQRPEVVEMLIEKSESMAMDIPWGVFGGRMVPSLVVARRAAILMQKEMGISFVDDLDGL